MNLLFERIMSMLTCSSKKEENHESSCGVFPLFPEIVDDNINTEEFLKASSGVVKLIDKFGKLFAPVRYEMQGNIEKIKVIYLTDMETNSTLKDMIMDEITTQGDMIGIEALLWLIRALHMIQLFFGKIVADRKCKNNSEDLVAVLKNAYEKALEPYHGWMAKQLFGLLSRMVPSRTSILQSLANNVTDKEEKTLEALGDFTERLTNNITWLHSFYAEWGLDTRRT